MQRLARGKKRRRQQPNQLPIIVWGNPKLPINPRVPRKIAMGKEEEEKKKPAERGEIRSRSARRCVCAAQFTPHSRAECV
jgi:hypothetical protein